MRGNEPTSGQDTVAPLPGAEVVSGKLDRGRGPCHLSRVRVNSGKAMIPALFTRICTDPSHPSTNSVTDIRSARSSCRTVTALLPVDSVIPAATRSTASGRRNASTTAAPTEASALAVSTPIPEAAPVTTARLPDRSTSASTSSAADANPNGVLSLSSVIGSVLPGPWAEGARASIHAENLQPIEAVMGARVRRR